MFLFYFIYFYILFLFYFWILFNISGFIKCLITRMVPTLVQVCQSGTHF